MDRRLCHVLFVYQALRVRRISPIDVLVAMVTPKLERSYTWDVHEDNRHPQTKKDALDL